MHWLVRRLAAPKDTRVARDWGENAVMAAFMGSIWSTFGLYFLDVWVRPRSDGTGARVGMVGGCVEEAGGGRVCVFPSCGDQPRARATAPFRAS